MSGNEWNFIACFHGSRIFIPPTILYLWHWVIRTRTASFWPSSHRFTLILAHNHSILAGIWLAQSSEIIISFFQAHRNFAAIIRWHKRNIKITFEHLPPTSAWQCCYLTHFWRIPLRNIWGNVEASFCVRPRHSREWMKLAKKSNISSNKHFAECKFT